MKHGLAGAPAKILAAAVLVTGCAPATPSGLATAPASSQTASSPDAASPAARAQVDEIRVASTGNVITTDPTQPHQVASFQVMVLTGGLLFRWNEEHEPVAELVESHEVSSDQLTYTMHLHEGLLFSDGSPLTTADVVYNWERVKDAPPVNKFLISMVDSLEAVDDRTLVWRLSRPNPDFLQWFGLEYLTIHPKAQVESDPAYWEHPVSSGPYMLTDWTPNSPTAVMEANPNYVGGELAIRKLVWSFVPDLTSRALQLAQGEVDYVLDMPYSVRDSMPAEVELSPHPIGGTLFIAINENLEGPLADLNVRKAISLALDRDLINQRAFFGSSVPATNLLYSGILSGAHLLGGGLRDVAGAQQALAETAYADGFAMTLQVWGSRPGWRDAALIVKENLAEIGIEVAVDSVEDSVGLERLASGNFEAQFNGSSGFPPGAYYGTTLQDGGIWQSWTKYTDSKVQELLLEVAGELDEQRRLELFGQIETLHANQLTYVPILDRVELRGTRVGALLGAARFSQYPVPKTLAQVQGEG